MHFKGHLNIVQHLKIHIHASGNPSEDENDFLYIKPDFLYAVQRGESESLSFRIFQEDLDEVPRLHNWKMVHFHNPKREAVDFIAHLYNTVHQYSCYKRDLQLVGNYTGKDYRLLSQVCTSFELVQPLCVRTFLLEFCVEEGEREAMDGTGKFVLSLFESLLARCDSIENDTTIFIEPYIEMLLRFSTKWEAKEVFHKICRNNFRNGILDELYLKFLEQQFPNLKDEIESQRNVSFMKTSKVYFPWFGGF